MSTIHRILEAIATETDIDETQLPPLYDVIDPDVVASFVESTNADAQLEFEYYDHVVTIDHTGQVEAEPMPVPATTA
jgi:hypothetical protein